MWSESLKIALTGVETDLLPDRRGFKISNIFVGINIFYEEINLSSQ